MVLALVGQVAQAVLVEQVEQVALPVDAASFEQVAFVGTIGRVVAWFAYRLGPTVVG